MKYSVLEGTYREVFDREFDELVEGLQRRLEEVSGYIMKEEITGKWAQAKGGKVSVNKVISYGILKCLAGSKRIMRTMEKFYTKIIPGRTTLKRWIKAIALMLEKSKGSRLNKLRIIQFTQCDL